VYWRPASGLTGRCGPRCATATSTASPAVPEKPAVRDDRDRPPSTLYCLSRLV
jgi:hypothetical protein